MFIWTSLCWVIGMMIIITICHNPLYIALLLIIVQLVQKRWGRQAQMVDVGRLAMTILPLSALFNMLFNHLGETILFRLPDFWIVGGPYTLEALIYGLVNGFMLITLLSLFITFNDIISPDQLVRIAPAAFYDVGLVILIALTYIPETIRHGERIRTAQMIRGYEMNRWRDWPPLIVPLLIGGLERAMSLAEAKVARGYGQLEAKQERIEIKLLIIIGLVGVLVGGVLSLWWSWGWLILLVGSVTIFFGIWLLGRRVKRTVYRPTPLTQRDQLLILQLIMTTLIIIWQRAQFAYSPYPVFTLPPFQLIPTLLLLLFGTVAWGKKLRAKS